MFLHNHSLQRAGILVCLAFLFPSFVFAQSIKSIHDKHRPRLASATQDSTRLQILLEYISDLTWANGDSALPVIREAEALSLQLKDTSRYAKTQVQFGNVVCDKGEYATAQKYYEKGIALYQTVRDFRGAGVTYVNIGNIYLMQDLYEEAIGFYLKAASMLEKTAAKSQLAKTYNNISSTFRKLGEHNKALHYSELAFPLAIESGDSNTLALSYMGMGINKSFQEDHQAAAYWLKKVIEVSDRCLYSTGSYMGRTNLAEVYVKTKAYDSALQVLDAAKPLAEESGTAYYLSSLYLNYSSVYHHLGRYRTAESWAQKALATSMASGGIDGMRDAYQMLTRIYAAMGQGAKTNKALDQYIRYSDSIQNKKTAEKVNLLETRYRTLQKDKEIADQQVVIAKHQASLRRKDFMIACAIAALIALLAFSTLFILNFRQKQKLQRQQLDALEKQRELDAMQAMFSGEERERARIAKDLHDGAASLITAAKLRMESIKRKTTEFPELEETLTLLGDASAEIRSTAHNLMPSLLYREGLHEAVASLCEKFNHPPLEVDYHVVGDPVRFHPHFELMVYRTVQELLNNIVKHAGATHAMVQLSFGPEHFSVVVEDDGRGFDPAAIAEKEGIGLTALESRLKAFKGEMDLQTSASGTSVNLEFDITD